MRDEHGLRRTEVRERRHQRVAGRGGLARQRGDDALQRRAAATESAGAGTAAGRATPARFANGPCADACRRRRAARRAAARRSCARLRRRRRRTPRSRGRARGYPRARRRSPRPLRSSRTPAPSSALAQARLPVTSSSNRRRSKAERRTPFEARRRRARVSNRPDQSVRQSCSCRGGDRSAGCRSSPWRTAARLHRRRDDATVALEELEADVAGHPFLHLSTNASSASRSGENHRPS